MKGDRLGSCAVAEALRGSIYFLAAQQAFAAPQELPLTAPMLASPAEPVIGQVLGALHSLLDEQDLLPTAPMLADLSEQVEEQLLLQPSPTAPIEALSEHSLLAEQHSDLEAQHSALAEQQPSLLRAPGLVVVLPVVAQPRRAQERKRAARPVTRIMGQTPLGGV